MRVIAGSAGGRSLRSVPGDTTRPITDRAKEALFSILRPWLPGAEVLDLFGGTGAVGIEALSRGAAHATFLDTAPAALRTMRSNLEVTGFDEQARVLRQDAFRFLRAGPAKDKPYDLIYIAPPQYRRLWLKALRLVDSQPAWLAEGGQVVVQIHPREQQPTSLEQLRERDQRRYGGVMLLFYEHDGAADAGDEDPRPEIAGEDDAS